jgi:beta-glucanase (GH16 family)
MSKQRALAPLGLAVLGLAGLGLTVPAPSQAMTARTVTPEAVTVQRAPAARGVTRLMPQIVQPGGKVAAAGSARLTGNVQFYPARPGRPVVVQRRLGTGPWRNVVTEKQNRAGVVYFVAAAAQGGRPYSYRGLAPRYRGAARVGSRPTTVAGWKQKFSDQFVGSSLNLGRWGYRGLGQYGPHRTRSASSKAAVRVGGGALKLSVRRDPSDPRKYLNGHVGTHEGKFSFTYGVASARIRFERRRGQHGAFWLLPDARRTIPGQPGRSGAEIDVAEYFGDGARYGGLGSFVYNYGILDGKGEPRKFGGVRPGTTSGLPRTDAWWKNYHVFTLQWTPTRYVFLVDGRPIWRTSVGVSAIPEHLILSLLTSDYELPRLDNSTLPTSMRVDWVRVWQR